MKVLKYIVYVSVSIVGGLLLFNLCITYLLHKGFAQSATHPDRWPVGSYVYDSIIGLDLSPGVSAPIQNGSFYVKSHQLGYRIGEHEDAVSYKPGGVLSLGCSFTYGDEVNSEQTFTQLLADSLQLPAYNYGTCSFSYIHALLKARQLKERGVLDKLQPRYVVLGCWNELPNRSRSPFPPLSTGELPFSCAYIDKNSSGFIIQPPMHSKYIFDLMKLYRSEGPELSFNKFAKLFVAAPRYLYQSMLTKRLREKVQAGQSSNQISNYDVYDYYFTGIENVFSKYNSRIIVLFMPNSAYDQPDEGLQKALAKHPHIMFANGLDAIKKYGVLDFDYVGVHPQPHAHAAYAREIYNMVKP